MSSLQAIISQRRIPAEIVEFASPLPTVELAAQAAGVAPEAIVKTLILHDGNGTYVAVVLAGDQRIDFNKVQQALSVKKLKFAPHADVLRVTGYPAGGTPPFGFDLPLPTLVDRSVLRQPYVMAGGGKPRAAGEDRAGGARRGGTGNGRRLRAAPGTDGEHSMNAQRDAIRTWQGWLDAFVRDASAEGLAAYMQSNDGELPPEALATLFHLRTLYEQANAMLLACLQLPSAEAEQALAAIAAAARGAGFAKPPRQLKGRQKDFYRRASRVLLRDYPPEADLLRSIFLHYLHDDYDAQADANLLLQEARFESARNQRAKALELAGQAGAAMLRSRRLWEGWVHEGEGDFPTGRWCCSPCLWSGARKACCRSPRWRPSASAHRSAPVSWPVNSRGGMSSRNPGWVSGRCRG